MDEKEGGGYGKKGGRGLGLGVLYDNDENKEKKCLLG